MIYKKMYMYRSSVMILNLFLHFKVKTLNFYTILMYRKN